MSRIEVLETRIDQAWRDESTHLRTLSDLNDVAASVSGWEDRGYVVSDLTSRIARVLDEMHPQVREIFEREPTFQGLEWARRRHPNGPPATPAAPAATPAAAPPHLRQYPLRRSPTEQAFFDQLVPELRRVLDNDPELTRTLRSRMGSAESPTENMQRFLADYFSMTVGHDEYLRLMEEDHNAPLRQLEAFRRGSDSGPLQRYFVIREPEGLVPVVRTNIGLWGGNKINLGNLENMAGESLQKMGGTNAALRALSESLDRENITVGGSPGAFNAGGLPTGHRSDAGKRVEDLPDYQGGHGPGHPTLHWFYARLGFDWRTGSRAPRSPWPRPLPTLEGVDRVAWNRRDFIGGAVNTKRQRIARKGAERAEATVGAEREKRWAEMRQRELEKMDPAARARHEAAQRGISGTQLPLPGMMPEGPAQAPEGYEPPPPPPPEVPAQQGAEGGPIRVQIGANNFLEYASPQQQRALLNSRMEDFRTNLTHGDGSRSGIVLHDLISQRRALRQHGPDAAPYLIDLDLAIDSGLTTLMEEGHPFYRDAYRRAVDAGVDIGGEATSQILLAEPDPITFGQENPGRRPETHQSPRAYQESLESDLEFFRERLFDYQDELPTLRNYRGPVSEIHSLLEDYEQVQEHWHLGMHPINTASAYAALQREHINERLRLLADVFPVQPEFPGLEPHERVESLTRRIHGLDVTRPHAELENLAEAMEARPPTLGSEAVSIEEAAQAINEIMSGREPSPPAPAVAEPASAPAPAAELPVAAAAPEGRTVEIDNNPWSGDRSFTISVPEAMEEARQHLELARTQHGRGSRWAARNLLLADGVLRALHPVVGQTGEMEELSSQYRDLLRQVSEEDLREVAAQYPAMEVPVREAIQGRQLTQHADVIERELQRLLREEPIITERSPETAERIAGLRESRQSLEDARGKLGRATPWLVGAALKGGVKPGVAQAEEMGVERPRVEARQEAPSPVEAPASQKPPRPLPATEPTPGTSVVPPAPPGPDAPPPPQPKAGTVEPARAYETPRAAKEAPAVRQAQSAYDAIQKKFPEALRSIEVEAAVRQGDKMMRKARTLEDAGKHAEALRYREAARLNFQSLERVAKLKGLTRTASRALGYASLPLIALDAYGMTKQAMEEGPAAVGRQVAEGMEEAGRGIGRVALPEKAEEALGLDEPGTLRGEEIREQRERAKRGIQEQEDDAEAREFFAAGGGLPPSASDILQERQEHWNLTDPEELARKRREAVQRAMAPQAQPESYPSRAEMNEEFPLPGIVYGDECYTVERISTCDAVFVERITPPGPRFSIPMKWLTQGTDLPTIYKELVEVRNGGDL
jgi:hypothetical protein